MAAFGKIESNGMPEKKDLNLEQLEIILEREIIGRCCQTSEEKKRWVQENAANFRKLVQEPEIIELIRNNRQKAIEEIENRLKEMKEK